MAPLLFSLPVEKNRRCDNDWLNVIAMILVFMFHLARYFDFEGWHVKNLVLSQGMSLWTGFFSQFIMPLFFFLSGVSSHESLRARNVAAYLGNRFKRLVIPLVFGTFVILIPLQVWVERVSHGQFKGGFFEFYPKYFEGFYAFGGNFAWMGLHLWYLEMLFIFTLITLPLFIMMKKDVMKSIISNMAAFFSKPAAISLMGLFLYFSELLVNLWPHGLGMRAFGGWSLLSYLVILCLGYVSATEERFKEAMLKNRYFSLAAACLLSTLMFICPIDIKPLGKTIAYIVHMFVRSFNCWFWLTAFIGFGKKYLDFSNSALFYVREAVLPFYILHQTVIVVIGFYLIPLNVGVFIKYLILGVISFSIITIIYEFMVKRIDVLRFCFGMKHVGKSV